MTSCASVSICLYITFWVTVRSFTSTMTACCKSSKCCTSCSNSHWHFIINSWIIIKLYCFNLACKSITISYPWSSSYCCICISICCSNRASIWTDLMSTEVFVYESTFDCIGRKLNANLRSFILNSPYRHMNMMPFIDISCRIKYVKKNRFCVYCYWEYIQLLKCYSEITLINIWSNWEKCSCQFILGWSNPSLESKRSIKSKVKRPIWLNNWSCIK